MPASAIVEIFAQIFGELAVHGFGELGKTIAKDMKEAAAQAEALGRSQVLAGADLLVLAAAHDHVITEAERAEIARLLPPAFARMKIEVTPDELIERWTERMGSITSEDELRRTIAGTGSVLYAKQKKRTFEAIVALARADAFAAKPATEGPMRAAATVPKSATVRLFGEALGIDAETVARACRR